MLAYHIKVIFNFEIMINKKIDKIKAVKCIKKNISLLNLDLTGLTVLTEVGSGPFIYNPLIPYLAGAKKIIVWCQDSGYGFAKDIVDEFNRIVNFDRNIYFRLNHRSKDDIQRADIITNSRMIRPIDSEFISFMRHNAVISLMYEAWEIRKSDIDIDFCKAKNIKVGGTWENHPDLNIFNYTKILSVKLLLESGVEIYQSNIFVWSKDNFGICAKEVFLSLGAQKVWNNTEIDEFYKNLSLIDVIYLCDYHENRVYFGDSSCEPIFDIDKIIEVKPEVVIVHLYGDVNFKYLNHYGLKCFPEKQGYPSIMTHTLSHVGIEPLIRLLVAGYKVGEDLYKNINNELIQYV